jgi:hypothetical protein
MAFLRAIGPPGEIVETDYRWTTALFSGHRTANQAFVVPCDDIEVIDAIQADQAGYLLSAAFNRPGVILSPCVLPLVASDPVAVRLYRTDRDKSSVFELIGPGTPHPDLRDVTPAAELSPAPTMAAEEPQVDGDPAGRYPTVVSPGDRATLTWTWTDLQPVAQVSLSRADAAFTTSVVVEIRHAGATWQEIARSAGPVGEDADAVRVTVVGRGTVGVHDLHVLASGW